MLESWTILFHIPCDAAAAGGEWVAGGAADRRDAVADCGRHGRQRGRPAVAANGHKVGGRRRVGGLMVIGQVAGRNPSALRDARIQDSYMHLECTHKKQTHSCHSVCLTHQRKPKIACPFQLDI